MWVPPHPHTGLQTVTWLFEGLGLHTDSLGSRQLIRPGQLNVMTAGHGICHAEVSPPDGTHPAARRAAVGRASPTPCATACRRLRRTWPTLPTYRRRRRHGPGAGRLAGGGDLVGSDVHAAGRGRADPRPTARRRSLPLDAGLRVRRPGGPGLGERRRRPDRAQRDELPRRRPRSAGVPRRPATRERTIVMLLGGEPFEEEIVMWWNFIGRSHEEIVEQREAWNGDGLGFRPAALRGGRGLRGRPAAGPADAEHPAAGPRPDRLSRPRPGPQPRSWACCSPPRR